MSDSPAMKTCSNPECGKTFPATTEYFSPRKGNKDGLSGQLQMYETAR